MNNQEEDIPMLPPTDGTIVKEDMEEVKENLDKQAWMNSLHRSDTSTNWQNVEAQTAFMKYKSKLAHGSNGNAKNLGFINTAGGKIIGQWQERGSNNLAGSITYTAYDSIQNILYAVSDGGSIFQGSINGLNWSVLNQDLRFDKRFLTVVYPPTGSSRLIASIRGIPYFLDTGGQWTETQGFNSFSDLKTKNLSVTNNGRDIFFLACENCEESTSLYHSKDYGQSFQRVRQFIESGIDKLSISGDDNGSDLIVLEQTSTTKSKLYEWESQADKLDLIHSNSSIGFGLDRKANLRYSKKSNSLYAVDYQDKLMKSNNKGQTWSVVSTLPVKLWIDDIFISSSNPNRLILSNVEAYRSSNGGSTWSKINKWMEYYQNPSINLHADIMHVAEYKTPEFNFIIVAHHGGMSISYDNGNAFSNIGLNGLNVSQYYSVKTSPKNSMYIFAGSQDQGIQRTIDFGEGTANFTQMFSGDFGHLQFTNNNNSLWTVFPGGLVLYYEDPTNSNFPTQSFFLEGKNNNVWLPPILPSPYHQNSVLLAGGSISGGFGSHIIELKINDFGFLSSSQLSFDFSVSGGTLSGLAINSFNTSHIYAITSNGHFYKSINRGGSFIRKEAGLIDAHYLYGTKILCSKLNSESLYLAGSGYDNSPIFHSQNGGESFQNIQYNLPPTTVFDLLLNREETILIAATEAGPYAYIISEARWYDLSEGEAPNQTYWSVEFVDDINTLRFATYGRGIWDLALTHLNDLEDHQLISEVKIYPNPASEFVAIQSNAQSISNVKIVNVSGEVFHQTRLLKHTENKIDVSTYPIGLYYIIFEAEKRLVTKSFIKL